MNSLNGNEETIVRRLREWFRRDGMILYLGKRYSPEKLSQIATFKWNCVFTSHSDSTLTELFVQGDERRPHDIQPFERNQDIQQLTNRRDLTIVRLFGMTQPGEDALAIGRRERGECRRLLEWLCAIMSRSMYHLVVLGYDPSCPDEVDDQTFYEVLSKLPSGSVSIFGAGEASKRAQELFRDLEENFAAKVWDLDLTQVLSSEEPELERLGEQPYELPDWSKDNKVFFASGNEVMLQKQWTTHCSNFARVLTDDEVNPPRIFGRSLLRDYFYLFLSKSATDWPQWYGYSRYHDYHLKRPCEDLLYELVQAELEDSGGQSYGNYPILLCGHPSSSKSVTLGALAYRIFQDQRHPVVYMRNPGLNFSAEGATFSNLNNLLKNLEEAGPKEQSVLLIWDCSSYGYGQIQTLRRSLENYGRKVVLVCSVYELPEIAERMNSGITGKARNLPQRCYALKEGKLTRVHKDVSLTDEIAQELHDFYVVHTVRKLNSGESHALKVLLQSYLDYNDEQFKQWWQMQEREENDIFLRLYYLLQFMRDPLRGRLSEEFVAVLKSEDLPLRKIMNDNTQFARAYQQAMRRKGVEVDNSFFESEKVPYKWADMCACVAMFSRFKMELPVSIALSILDPGSKGDYALLPEVVTAIPWLCYGPAGGDEESGRYAFSFRTALDAQLFLTSNNISERQQIDYVLDILKQIGRRFLDTNERDVQAITAIERFIRLIGPNTQSVSLLQEMKAVHQQFQQCYPRLIGGLANLRRKYKVCDEYLLTLEVTLIREFYGGYKSLCQDCGDASAWQNCDANEEKECADSPDDVEKGAVYVDDLDSVEDEAKHAISPCGVEGYEIRICKLQDAMKMAEEEYNKLLSPFNGGVGIDWDQRRRQYAADALLVERVSCDRDIVKKLFPDYLAICDSEGVAEHDRLVVQESVLRFRDCQEQFAEAIARQPTNSYCYNAVLSLFLRDSQNSEVSASEKNRNLMWIWQLIGDLENNPMLELEAGNQEGLREYKDSVAEVRTLFDQQVGSSLVTIDNLDECLAAPEESEFVRFFRLMQEERDAAAILFLVEKELCKNGITLGKDSTAPEKDIWAQQEAVCRKVLTFLDRYKEIAGQDIHCIFRYIQLFWKVCNSGLSIIPPAECWWPKLSHQQWEQLMLLCKSYLQHPDAERSHNRYLVTFLDALAHAELGYYSDATHKMQSVNKGSFYTSNLRVKCWYIITDLNPKTKEAAPRRFTGRVIRLPENKNDWTGRIRLSGVEDSAGGQPGVYFKLSNLDTPTLGGAKEPMLSEVELGIGFTGFAAYRHTKDGGRL